ncbi:MAG: hypothetical protein LBS33_06525 [Streptococcaceae bacterium]|jgi:hypothetical protein|nr:hypothetical protein [Streptococcaceae bacterium]
MKRKLSILTISLLALVVLNGCGGFKEEENNNLTPEQIKKAEKEENEAINKGDMNFKIKNLDKYLKNKPKSEKLASGYKVEDISILYKDKDENENNNISNISIDIGNSEPLKDKNTSKEIKDILTNIFSMMNIVISEKDIENIFDIDEAKGESKTVIENKIEILTVENGEKTDTNRTISVYIKQSNITVR